MYNNSLENFQPRIEAGVAAVTTCTILREDILIEGDRGIAGLIYALLLSGKSTRATLMAKASNVLGLDAGDAVCRALTEYAGVGPNALWWSSDEDAVDPEYELVI